MTHVNSHPSLSFHGLQPSIIASYENQKIRRQVVESVVTSRSLRVTLEVEVDAIKVEQYTSRHVK
jgi:hypothetical protein